MRYTTTPCPAKAHSQARRPPTRQPVSSGATTGLACTPSASAGVDRLAAARRPRHRLGHPTRGDLKAELAEQPGDLAGRQPQPLVAPGGQRDRARADLDAGRAQQRPIATSNRVIWVALGGGKSSWCWSATRSKGIGPPQDGQAAGSGTLTTQSTRSGTGRRARLP
jgi:hypothetical protein